MAITFASYSLAATVESSPGTHELDTIVVTGTRTEKHLTNSPVRTEVIASDVLEKQHARNMQDALRYAPGVLLKDIHGKTGQSAWMQGFDSDRVLVLINGEKIAASTGSTVDLSQLSTLDIQQIELVKGAASALYGSEAMGGVINIITKRPQQGWHGKLTADAGSYLEKNRDNSDFPARYFAAGNLSYATDTLRLSASGDIRQSEGYEIEQGGYQLKGEDGYKSNQQVSAQYQLSESLSTGLSYRGYSEHHVLHDDIAIPGQAAIDRTERVNSHHVTWANDWLINADHALSSKTYGQTYEGQTQSDIHRKGEIVSLAQELQHDWVFNDDNWLTQGIALHYDALEQARNLVSELEGKRPTRQRAEIYTQWDTQLNSKWELVSGARLQHDSEFGFHFSPKISAMFSHQLPSKSQAEHPIEGRLRLSAGQGYRAPNLKEHYFIFDHSNNGYKVLGNPELKPESSLSLQLGYELFQTHWQAQVSLFYNAIQDLIVTTLTDYEGSTAIYEYANIDRAQTYGVELSAAKQFNTLLALNGSYVFTQAENTRSGKALIKRPKHVIKLGSELSFFDQSTQLSVLWRYQSEEYVDEQNQYQSPAYSVLDTKINQLISPNFSVFAGVDNVFDVHRNPYHSIQEQDLRPVPGRMIYGGFTATF